MLTWRFVAATFLFEILAPDGEFEEPDNVMEVCRELHAKNCRVFSFGVGSSASESQIRGLASAGVVAAGNGESIVVVRVGAQFSYYRGRVWHR